jgi:hypothetical protein
VPEDYFLEDLEVFLEEAFLVGAGVLTCGVEDWT